ncbi:MAG: 16S rRNA (adenine(1518)-N(6)/adenine(1519)-N(6))-dimethyltransferase RsmA [Coriobacteriia bacterium]|nr:16S rRNA (adenine(1518)-N(6)/adenine(1519)-N(6))-dimethyltransferase RsmA [Coriobacteriia bacterium]
MTYSALATPSATRAVLARHGLATKKSLGQHFLIDDNVIGRILSLADVHPDQVVLEVGPGIGTLTVALCTAAGAVVAVERDADLLPVLAETTELCPRFAVVHADAVAVSPEAIAESFGAPTTLVANLPYAVAATVVLRFFEELPALCSATVMVQSEVAARMAAVPGSKDYGAYTVKLRLLAEPVGRFSVARGCFLPPPRVDSAVLRLNRSPLAQNPALLYAAARVADAAFAQRRKTLRNSLKASLGIDGAALDGILAAAGIDGSARAETLPPERYLELAEAFVAGGVALPHRARSSR